MDGGVDTRAVTRLSPRHYALAVLVVVAVTVAVLLAMGRVPICTCGYIKPWHGVVSSSENSQHLSDWYTFSHIIHGFGFYLLFWLAGRRAGWPIGLRLVLAVALESAWEILENTPLIINRYRAQTIALDYFGDSVLNSLADISAMILGFFLASRWPVWLIVVLTIVMEVAVGYWIRDNLALNIIQLIHPIDAILRWQQG
ncbi:MAG TPA: DUF2585 domain-containing protein [Vicinamibacterales bacterium]|nr:DUF2585 domain-containing protein [Vicinamibacterales bacterium]